MRTISPLFKRFFLLGLALLLSSTVHAQLNGTYTIGGVSPDYATISDAVSDLNGLGISGPVVFQIRGGTYDEQVTITNFTRTGNADDTVTFTRPSPAFTVTWQYTAATAGSNWVVKLNGADYVILQGITFNATAPSPTGRLVVFENGADHNTIRNATLEGHVSPGSRDGSLVYADGTANSFNFFETNTFTRGYRGIDFDGLSGTLSEDNHIYGNTFGAQEDHGLRMRWQDGVVVDSNFVNDATVSDVTYVGMLVDGPGAVVTRNRVDVDKGEIGIRLQSGDAPRRLIANNMVAMNGANVDAGIVLATLRVDVLHNTVKVDAPVLAAALRINSSIVGGPDVAIRNNLFVNDGAGVTMRLPDGTLIASSDYNNLYTTGSFIVEWEGLVQGSLENYQAASGLDANSTDVDVTFADVSVDIFDLHLAGTSDGNPNLVAPFEADVTVDFDNDARGTLNTYKGADEATASLAPLDNADTASGFYTVGGTTPDFTNPSRAITHLNRRGIKGKTTFRIRTGTYDVNKVIENFTRHAAPFGGEQDSVLFRAADLNNPPTLRHAAITPSDNWVLKLDGADGVLFRKIDFVADGLGQWGNIIVMENSADDNVFFECTFTGVTGQTDESAALIFSDDPDIGGHQDDTVIEGSTFTNGSYGIFLASLPGDTTPTNGNRTTVENNTFIDQEAAALLTDHFDVNINGNTVTNTNAGAVGFYLEEVRSLKEITKNQLNLTSSTSIGMFLDDSDGTSATSALIANNFIHAGTGMDINNGSQHLNIFHNTVYATGTDALKISGALHGSSDVANNILYNQAAPLGYALNVSDASLVGTSDYNIIYNGSGTDNVIHWDGTDYLTLQDFQNATGLQPHSAAEALLFVDAPNADLHLAGASLTNPALAGLPVPEVTDDIDGQARGIPGFPVPYIGADERLDSGPLGITGNINVLLSGPYDSGTLQLNTDLNSTGALDTYALASPYTNCPPASVPAGFFAANPTIVDWVCVRILTGDPLSPPMTEVATRAGLIDADGDIFNTGGSGDILFVAGKDAYYVVVEHRNHLAVMSADPIDFNDGSGFWDTRFDLAQAYTGGGIAMQDLGSGRFGLWGGDGDQNGSVSAFDFLNEWLPINGGPLGYDAGDFDMNGSGTAFDFLTVWLPANGQASQVP